MVRIETATAHDLAPLCALLGSVGLPTEGLREHLETALVARDGEAIVGCVALEVYGETALLRSLAVTPSRQGVGLGYRLVQAALSLGHGAGVNTFCLLTSTAQEFFAREFDFRSVARGETPGAVQQSVEFASVCPAAAQAMMLVR